MSIPFIPPAITDLSLDHVCGQIVRALEARAWNVPGVTVRFIIKGTGKMKVRRVSEIRTDECAIGFTVDGEVTRLAIPYQDLRVQWGKNGPTTRLFTFSGADWHAVSKAFLDDKFKTDPAYTQAPYCTYEGQQLVKGMLPPRLERVGNDGARLLPSQHGYAVLGRQRVEAELERWLYDHLLWHILSTPEVPMALRDDVFDEKIPWPVPATLGPLFTCTTPEDAMRIRACDGSGVEDYGLKSGCAVGGVRTELAARLGEPFTEVHNVLSTVSVCGMSEVALRTPLAELAPSIIGLHPYNTIVVRVVLNRANQVYVTDAPQLIDADAPAKQLVPLNQYFYCSERFANPVVLVARELDFDEVELVSGPWPEFTLARIAWDDSKGRELLECFFRDPRDDNHLAGLARWLVRSKQARRMAGIKWWHPAKKSRMFHYLRLKRKSLVMAHEFSFLR